MVDQQNRGVFGTKFFNGHFHIPLSSEFSRKSSTIYMDNLSSTHFEKIFAPAKPATPDSYPESVRDISDNAMNHPKSTKLINGSSIWKDKHPTILEITIAFMEQSTTPGLVCEKVARTEEPPPYALDQARDHRRKHVFLHSRWREIALPPGCAHATLGCALRRLMQTKLACVLPGAALRYPTPAAQVG